MLLKLLLLKLLLLKLLLLKLLLLKLLLLKLLRPKLLRPKLLRPKLLRSKLLRLCLLMLIARREGARPKWKPKRGEIVKLENKLMQSCRQPEEWANLCKPFELLYNMKTSELLNLAGGVGTYVLQFLSIDNDFRARLVELLRLLHIIMHKVSTPGDRQKLRLGLPRAVTAMEIFLPLYVDTAVMHILVCETVSVLENTGPFLCYCF